MRQRIINKVLPIAILVVVFITAISLSIMRVYASEGFTDNSEVWHNTNNSIKASQTGTYPYNTDSSITVKCVPLDVLYGTTKGWGLIQYHGEVPYVQTYDESSDETAKGFGKKPVRPDTTIAYDNDDTNNPGDVTAKDYWGFNSDTKIKIDGSDKTFSKDTKSAKLNEYEKINNSEVISLRLYALANTSKSQFFSNLLYTIGVGLAGLATMILGLIVDAKNIDMEEIMNMLNLQEISDIMTSSFIYNTDSSVLSPFALFAIVMFIFAIVAYAIKYAKGSDKTTGLKDIIATALIGLLVIGICLSGRVVSLGSTAADFANKLIATAAGVSSGSSGGAFVVIINDTNHSNKVAQLAETTLVNKTFIDMQICTQFGVSRVSDLNFKNLGDDGGTLATTAFGSYLDGANVMTDFDGNLGYYYWFANSSAEKKTSLNATYPSSNSLAIEGKLDSIITYLQMVYNNNKDKGNTAQNENIKHIILALAKPNGATGFVSMLLLTIVLAITGICIFRYCLNVMIAKLELFLAILGLAVAGPLILTSNKKLIGTGKVILGMIPVAFIEITVYSIVFDVILFLVSSLMSTEVFKMLILIALLLLLMKLNPIVQEKIKQLLNSTTRTISPALANARRSIKTYTQRKANDILSNYDKSKKVVGRDKDGNAIMEEREGNALSKLMHHGYNAMYNDGLNREGFGKINKKSKEARDRNTARSAETFRRDAEARVGEIMSNIKNDASSLASAVKAEEATYKAKHYSTDYGETIYNIENLTEADKAKASEIANLKAEVEAIKNSDTYKKLMAEKNYIDTQNAMHKGEEGYEFKEFDADRSQKLDNLKEQISHKTNLANQLDTKLKQSIDNNARDFAFDKLGLDKNVEGNNDTEKLNNATNRKAQSKHADELEKALKDGINTVKDEVNTKTSSKIGSSNATVNRQALSASAAMMQQLNQLNNNELVSDTNKAKEEVQDIVDMIAQHNDGNAGSNSVENAQRNYKESKKVFNTGMSKEERKENKANAKAELKEAKKEAKENKQEGKENYRESVEAYGRNIASVGPVNIDVSKSTIAEQLTTAMKDRPTTASSDLAKATLTKASAEKSNANNSTSTESAASNTQKQTLEKTAKNNTQSTQRATSEAKPQPQTQSQRSNTLEKMAKEKESTTQQNNQSSNKTNVKLDVPNKESKPLNKPEKQTSRVDIEKVKPITRDKSEYLKDEGREYLAKEKDTSNKDFWDNLDRNK